MKKKIIAVAAATIIGLSAFLGGCSCAGQDPLSFNISPSEQETLTYTVKYDDSYIDSYKKDSSVGDFFEYGIGTYVATCKKVVDRERIDSDIKEQLNDKDIFELTTDFNIDLTFTISGTTYIRTETMSTLSYIASSGMSLAPLYAKESAEYVIFSSTESSVKAAIVKTESETKYNQSNYTKTKKYKTFNLDEEIDFKDAKTEEYTTNYTFRTAIDNTELYFALRGLAMSIQEKSSTKISVISPSFNNPEYLTITNNGNATGEFTFKYNGTEITENITYTNLAYSLSDTNASGKPQYVLIQKDNTDTLKNCNILLRFAKPLFLYGSFKNMGALVFTISEIER